MISNSQPNTDKKSKIVRYVCNDHNFIKFLLWNVHGYNNFLTHCNEFTGYDVICLNETWLTSSLINPPVCFNGFTVFSSRAIKEKSRGRASGGNLVLVKNSLGPAEIIEITEWWIFFRVVLTMSSLVIGVIYCKPNLSINE